MDVMINTLDGDLVENINLLPEIFNLKPRSDILHRVICWQLARRRQGTHQCKNRSSMLRTGAKMHKQKGTGKARHSSNSAPQFRGGGKAHGPIYRSHSYHLPKKIRFLGLRHALSAKMKENNIIIINQLKIEEAKTKILVSAFKKLNISNALFVDKNDINHKFLRAISNIPNVNYLPVKGINVYDILRHKQLVISTSAINCIEERFQS